MKRSPLPLVVYPLLCWDCPLFSVRRMTQEEQERFDNELLLQVRAESLIPKERETKPVNEPSSRPTRRPIKVKR